VTNESGNIKKSILRCLRDQEFPEIFFSLMDYRNNYFLSKNPKDIIHFYEGFENREELIDWMKERPKGSCEIKEVEGEKDVVVVIPTADFEAEYAKRCREEIFKGLHIIFVVSGIGNNYFNIAHNCNIGIKKAMEYSPKWILVSNDDMYKIDDVKVLKNELSKIDFRDYDVVFTYPSKYHSIPDNLGMENILRKIVFTFFPGRRMQKKIERKFNVTLFPAPVHSYFMFFYKPGYRYISFADFSIFSGSFVGGKNGELFNEDFVNGGEDNDLSLKVSLKRERYTFINYRIGDYQGQSLGTGTLRQLRNVTGLTLLNYMIDNDLHPASEEIKKYI